MKGLNLSSFKKVSEDKDSAIMRHADGHTLRIAKAPLPALQRKQLEKLPIHAADGDGDVGNQDQPAMQQVSVDQPGQTDATPLDVEPASPDAPQATNQAPAEQPTAQSPGAAQMQGFQEEKQGIQSLANAQALQGTNESQSIEDVQNQLAALPTAQDITNANKAKSDELYNEYASKKLDPNHYWHSLGTAGQITSGIGMLLSGLGSGFSHQPNAALAVMDNAINRDMEAQKNSQDKSANLWRMNREALGNDLAANLATRNQMLTGLKFQLDKSAADARGPIAQANAQIGRAKIDQEIGLNSAKLGLLSNTRDFQDPADKLATLQRFGMVPPEAVPKIGGEIDAAKDTVANAPGIMDAFDQASKEVRPLTGGAGTSMTAFVPGMRSPGQAALIARLGPTFKDVEGTVRQAAMDNMEHNVTPKFGDNDATIASKRASLGQYLKSKEAASTARAYGINLAQFPSTSFRSVGGKTQSAPVSPTKNGVAYAPQVIGGKSYMVPVRQ